MDLDLTFGFVNSFTFFEARCKVSKSKPQERKEVYANKMFIVNP